MLNKSNLFKTAWNLKKVLKLAFKTALKWAWSAIKNDVKSVKVWENYGKVRLYVTVAGVSEYQHRKGNMFVELTGGTPKAGNSSVPSAFVRALEVA